MRIRSLLVLLTFAVLGLTSGCHHHCCRSSCCTPCGTCCGYTPEGPMPPMAAPVMTPQMPVAGVRVGPSDGSDDVTLQGASLVGTRVRALGHGPIGHGTAHHPA